MWSVHEASTGLCRFIFCSLYVHSSWLVFLTGTNRIPIEGFKRMKVMIQRSSG